MRKLVLAVAVVSVLGFAAWRQLQPTPNPLAGAYAKVKDRVPAGQALFVLFGSPG